MFLAVLLCCSLLFTVTVQQSPINYKDLVDSQLNTTDKCYKGGAMYDAECDSCIGDTNCVWCSTANYKVCMDGSITGPSNLVVCQDGKWYYWRCEINGNWIGTNLGFIIAIILAGLAVIAIIVIICCCIYCCFKKAKKKGGGGRSSSPEKKKEKEKKEKDKKDKQDDVEAPKPILYPITYPTDATTTTVTAGTTTTTTTVASPAESSTATKSPVVSPTKLESVSSEDDSKGESDDDQERPPVYNTVNNTNNKNRKKQADNNKVVQSEDRDDPHSEINRLQHHANVSATVRARQKRVATEKSEDIDRSIGSEIEEELQEIQKTEDSEDVDNNSQNNSDDDSEEQEPPKPQYHNKRDEGLMTEVKKKGESIDAMIKQMEMEFGQNPPITVDPSEQSEHSEQLDEDSQQSDSYDNS